MTCQAYTWIDGHVYDCGLRSNHKGEHKSTYTVSWNKQGEEDTIITSMCSIKEHKKCPKPLRCDCKCHGGRE